MHGWCEGCKAVAFDGICSEHGKTKPLGFINAIDVRPLTEYEKQIINEKQKKLKLKNGIFLVYGDRYYRRKIVFLDKILVEFKFLKDGIHVNPIEKGNFQGMNKHDLINVNKDRLNRLIETSKGFAGYEHNENGYKSIISFSGGKDSIALAHLLKEQNMKMVFIDTRIEFPETYSIINQYKNNGDKLDIVKAENSFFSLCKEKGYPSRDDRWCCKTQKFKPFNDYLNDNYNEEYVRVYTGQRRWESIARLDSPFIKLHKYITKQLTVQPMLEWLAMDVWNYTWVNNLPVNNLYNTFVRAGCWTCPFGLQYRAFFLRHTHPKLFGILKKYDAISNNYLKNAVEEQKPCQTEIDGRLVKTCDAFGHHFMNGKCRRCGYKETTEAFA